MVSKIKICLIAVLLGMLTVTCLAEDKRSGFQSDFNKFSTYYYLNPEPDRVPAVLKDFLESELFTNKQICDEHCRDLIVYFFARTALLEPKLLESYKFLFENGTQKQRLFVLKILQRCGDQEIRKFFISKLREGRFAKEEKQITRALKQGIPVEFNALTRPVTKAGDLDFLWTDFGITGNEEAVVKIIKSLGQDSTSAESLLLVGAAKWSLGANCKEHKKVFKICKEELSKANGVVKEVLQEIVTETEQSDLGYQSTLVNKERLEARVKEILKKDNVSQRVNVDELFSLADIYANEGNDKKAITLYEKALGVNSWRLEYQLKLARLLKKHGNITQALDKAKVVYQHAEDENLTQDAGKLLEELGVKLPIVIDAGETEVVDTIEIVMVPVGRVDKRLLNEIKEDLQKKMGIKYSVLEMELDPGKIDRSKADRYLARMINRIKSKFPQKNIQQLLSELALKEADLENYDGRVKLAEGFLRKVGSSQQEIEKFHDNLKKWQSIGQYDASRFLSALTKRFKIQKGSNIKGYLGITDKDIFAKDFNFLYSWARRGYGVMSYHRFRADFNNELPDRLRLRRRSVKQGVASSFFILGIPRCTTPTCVRAYPHDLEELDQKGMEICPWCRKRLKSFINQNK